MIFIMFYAVYGLASTLIVGGADILDGCAALSSCEKNTCIYLKIWLYCTLFFNESSLRGKLFVTFRIATNKL